MKISYSDIQRGSDYMGTKIIIEAESRAEWWGIQLRFISQCLPHKGSWFYKHRATGRKIEAWGYDGFLASLVERKLTGDRVGWLGKSESELAIPDFPV